MSDILKAFSGKKTYLVSAILAFIVFAFQMGWIDKDMMEQLWIILTGAGFAALRAAVESTKTEGPAK